ncbi:uncharacterized protein LOC125742735 [Brienomyrus brachyistius]|uniref:uncharacterized protein LOC125742735 n=1 Tax=Brienomyrus brachyistius TaxID=42636 RepID=UPI0020B3CE16|nr:uncharacterized protein LOC125742735 [Brienomyrus brachyistius]XP_048870959.1 uncharacterized protein LOC125742735 [Brienomyrus brachyistius]XP_048870960.1 uncharacterized protein LOC125742735 [Brienomyrus brachyistius]XP_048870961.1 uncharacterized protein LOC125742735 [Brienomyrus brachyistius]
MNRKRQLCPLCHAPRFNVSVHLRNFHKMDSKTERKLINSVSSGRFAGPINCPVANCLATNLSRVDRHLRLCHQLQGDELKRQITAAKRNAARQSLQEFKSQYAAERDEIKDLQRRITYLEEQVAHLFRHPSSAVSQASHKLLFSDTVLAKYRESMFRVGASSKYTQNQKQELAYIKMFVNFMWDTPQSPAAAHLKYLLNLSKVNVWLSNLNKKFKVDTMKNYILAVTKFCRFLWDAQLSCVQLGRREINRLLRHFKCQLKILSKRVVKRRQQVKDWKMQRMTTTPRRRIAAVILSSSEEEEAETQKDQSGEGTSAALSGRDTGESQASEGETSGVQVPPQTPVTEAGSVVMAGEPGADEENEFTEEVEFKLFLDEEEEVAKEEEEVAVKEEEEVAVKEEEEVAVKEEEEVAVKEEEEVAVKDEEQVCKLPRVLPKSVPRSRTSLLRRKLTYTDAFKDRMKARFQPYWGRPIKTGVIHRVLAESPGLLQTCKDMSLTIDNVRGLLKQLQQE